MKRLFLTLTLILFSTTVVGCSKSSRPSVAQEVNAFLKRDEELRAQMSADNVRLLETDVRVASVIDDMRSPNTSCSDARWTTTSGFIDTMKGVPKFWQLITTSPVVAPSLRRDAIYMVGTSSRMALDAQFKVADFALSKSCLDLADAQYRNIIQVYTGAAYAAHRERARLGIDDVNRLKARVTSK